jgi:DNA-binding GntR family transcriptional regulator
MARLASEGLLATHRRSFTVPEFTLADADEIYELRFLLEPAAMRRIAAAGVDAPARVALEAALAAAQEAHRAGDAAAFREANVAWRRVWLALVPNARLVRIIELYADHMQHIRTLTLGTPRVRPVVLRGLRRMTAAIGAGDADGAEQAAREHLQQARHAFVHALGLPDPQDGAALPGSGAAATNGGAAASSDGAAASSDGAAAAPRRTPRRQPGQPGQPAAKSAGRHRKREAQT